MKTNFKFGEVHDIKSVAPTKIESVGFGNIFETENGGVSVVSFTKGQKLDTHQAPFEVMVNVVEGEVEFTMLDKPNTLKAGEFLLMGADVPHSVKALADAKLMLVKIKN